MKNVFTTKRLCRAGVIAALYVVLTYAFMSFAFGPFQVRPAEALCILPLFFPEAVPALFVGCLLSNLVSQYSVYDVVFGSLTTLIAALCTYGIGKTVKKDGLKIFLGGLFPVVLNAFAIPLIIVFLLGDMGTYQTLATAYFANVAIFLFTQAVWVYALGTPLYFSVKRLLKGK
ncbi:MAG: QueT transporter family protein [Clostridia bacterium]|nr:QueT transporter family protein [Clostridia bacterium]